MLHDLTIPAGKTSIVGRAVIVHANPDDYTSQPVGNAGGRIACGLIAAG
jgi:Cu-Zn family superoxide dismutase